MSKEYRNLISQNVKHLKNTRVENAKRYWRIINSVEKKQPPSPPLKDLYTYFKNLNSCDNDQVPGEPSSCQEDQSNSSQEISHGINKPISPSEVHCAIEKFKNNKSPDIDNILNEHIKSTSHLLLPIYTKIFNIVFDTGIVPENWAVGDIYPYITRVVVSGTTTK